MIRKRNYGTLVVLLVISVLFGTACKSSAEKLNQEGNERFAEEAYLEALHAYQSAQIESPELAEPYYNAASALYREGAYEEALAQLEQAMQFVQLDEETYQSLAENGFYNLGNTSFNQESWEAAIAAYREALLRNPGDQDAKYNLELALQQLQQQQEQQQQEQQQDQDQQDQNQQDENQPNQDQQSEEQQQEQSEDGEGSENEQEQSQDQSQDDQQDQGDENTDQNSGNNDQQEQDQENQSQNGQEQGDAGSLPSNVPPSGQGMTAEQAAQLLAAIAAESETLQEKLGQIFIVPSLPPVQDW